MRKKIRVEDRETGMFVADFNVPWLDHPFLPNQKMVDGTRDIRRMLRYGMQQVVIDTGRGKDSPKAIPLHEAERDLQRRLQEEVIDDASGAALERPRVPFEAEYRRAREIYSEAKDSVREHFDDVEQGRRVDGETAHDTVADMIKSIFRNRDALLCLARLKSYDEYTFHHSLNVTVLSLSLAVHLGILQDELVRLGVGAVLHDLGKVRVPGGLIQKKGRLEHDEFEVVKTHAAHGAKIILEARDIPLDCAQVPLSHHERYDGSGYPRRLAGHKVGKFGLITAIADVYDAMTTDRPYQKGMAPTLALKKIFDWAGSHFHPVYVRRFIQCVGIYPIGSLVEMDTGERGVVTCQNHGELLRPWVRLTHAPTGAPLDAGEDVDLRSKDPRGEKLYARTILGVADAGRAAVNVEGILASARASGAADPEPLGAAVG